MWFCEKDREKVFDGGWERTTNFYFKMAFGIVWWFACVDLNWDIWPLSTYSHGVKTFGSRMCVKRRLSEWPSEWLTYRLRKTHMWKFAYAKYIPWSIGWMLRHIYVVLDMQEWRHIYVLWVWYRRWGRCVTLICDRYYSGYDPCSCKCVFA